MDIIGTSGLLVSIAGFALSLWQIRKARTAAESASAAAVEAVEALRLIQSVANIQEICGHSRELLHLIRAGNLEAAAITAFELRDLVARFHATTIGRRLADTPTWQQIFKDLRSIHDGCESAIVVNMLWDRDREILTHKISELHTQFSSFAAAAADTGVNHGNSR